MQKNMPHSMPVTQSSEELFFDTISALKLSFACGTGRHIYSYLKMYSFNGALCAAAYVFEKEPDEKSTFALVLPRQNSGASSIFIEATQNKVSLHNKKNKMELPQLFFDNSDENNAEILNSKIFKGSDEQGFYWGMEFIIPKEALACAGISLESDKSFSLAAFNYNKVYSGFFSSSVPSTDNFNSFLIVDY